MQQNPIIPAIKENITSKDRGNGEIYPCIRGFMPKKDGFEYNPVSTAMTVQCGRGTQLAYYRK